MTIDQQTLIAELQSLEKQRQETLVTLQRIEGAQSMCRHLLTRSQATQVPTEIVRAATAEEIELAEARQSGRPEPSANGAEPVEAAAG